MQPTMTIALLSALFVATHIGMAAARTRAWMVSRLGENLFVGLYSAVASAQFGLLLAYYAAHRFEGAAGLGLGATPAIRGALIAVIAVGITLMGGSLAGYPDSPFSALAHNFREPYGIERITRHPFFAGTFCSEPPMGSLRRISTGPSSFRRWRSWPWQAHAIRTANFSSAEARPIGTISKPRRCCHSRQLSRADSASCGANYRSED